MDDIFDGDPTECEICGETFRRNQERGEFANIVTGDHYIAHAECGLNDPEMELA